MNPQDPFSDTVQQPSPQSTLPTGPAMAQDSDKIEPEWVHKAEQVVSQTRRDPYEQARQLNALKADYMLKRYAKEIKVADES